MKVVAGVGRHEAVNALGGEISPATLIETTGISFRLSISLAALTGFLLATVMSPNLLTPEAASSPRPAPSSTPQLQHYNVRHGNKRRRGRVDFSVSRSTAKCSRHFHME